jgi:hypothetical protein
MGAILVNSILKLTVLHNSTYQNLFSFFPSLHLVASTGTEHAVFVSAVFFGKGILSVNLMMMTTVNLITLPLFLLQ